MVVLDAVIVNVALPHIQRALGFSGSGLEWVVAVANDIKHQAAVAARHAGQALPAGPVVRCLPSCSITRWRSGSRAGS
jgi:hypothetical protein